MHGLPSKGRKRALQTIDDLGLNKLDVRFYRFNWTRQFIEDWQDLPIEEKAAFAEFATRTGNEFVGIILMAVRQLSDYESV